MKTILAFALISVSILFFVGEVIRNSPIGYEDENGFHYGKDPRSKDDEKE